jgi:hypothetical protein
MSVSKTATQLITLVVAFVSGCGTATIAILISAGGHGWTAAVISASAVLTAPAGAAAWSVRHDRYGRSIATFVMFINTMIDTEFLILTWREGFEYAAETIEHHASLVAVWAALWLIWQAVPVLALLRTRRPTR